MSKYGKSGKSNAATYVAIVLALILIAGAVLGLGAHFGGWFDSSDETETEITEVEDSTEESSSSTSVSSDSSSSSESSSSTEESSSSSSSSEDSSSTSSSDSSDSSSSED